MAVCGSSTAIQQISHLKDIVIQILFVTLHFGKCRTKYEERIPFHNRYIYYERKKNRDKDYIFYSLNAVAAWLMRYGMGARHIYNP